MSIRCWLGFHEHSRLAEPKVWCVRCVTGLRVPSVKPVGPPPPMPNPSTTQPTRPCPPEPLKPVDCGNCMLRAVGWCLVPHLGARCELYRPLPEEPDPPMLIIRETSDYTVCKEMTWTYTLKPGDVVHIECPDGVTKQMRDWLMGMTCGKPYESTAFEVQGLLRLGDVPNKTQTDSTGV